MYVLLQHTLFCSRFVHEREDALVVSWHPDMILHENFQRKEYLDRGTNLSQSGFFMAVGRSSRPSMDFVLFSSSCGCPGCESQNPIRPDAGKYPELFFVHLATARNSSGGQCWLLMV